MNALTDPRMIVIGLSEGMGGFVGRTVCGGKSQDVNRAKIAISLLLAGERFEESLEGGFQVCFIVNHQGVLSEEAGVVGAGFEAGAVAVEKETAADHVDGADDDSGASWIGGPGAVVGELAAKCADGERLIVSREDWDCAE